MFIFFFQAEDGIRDIGVTGVQTCALPICYVRIETADKVIEMSLVLLVVFFVIAMAVVYSIEWCISRFCRLSKGSYNWFFNRKQKKAQQETLEGLMKMSEGRSEERRVGKECRSR